MGTTAAYLAGAAVVASKAKKKKWHTFQK
jgi:hypothetical protein